jgi:hypothetical protein
MGLDDKTREVAGCFKVGVDRTRELRKVLLLERGLWLHVENGVRSVKAVFDHGELLSANKAILVPERVHRKSSVLR